MPSLLGQCHQLKAQSPVGEGFQPSLNLTKLSISPNPETVNPVTAREGYKPSPTNGMLKLMTLPKGEGFFVYPFTSYIILHFAFCIDLPHRLSQEGIFLCVDGIL